ncbi:MAG: M28 family peptidase [Gemmatimonadaceae bacterium]
MPVGPLIRVALVAAAATPAILSAQRPELPRAFEPRPTQPAITAADLMTRLYIVADDSMAGRASGTEGHLKATAYIERELRRLGLRPAGTDGFFQDLPLYRRSIAAGGSITAGDRRFVVGADFGALAPRGGTVSLPATAEVVVGGTMGDSTTWITAEQAAGKVVVMRPNGRSLTLGTRGLAVTATSRFAGAVAYVVPLWDQLAPPMRQAIGRPTLSMVSAAPATPLPPTIIASAAMTDALIARGLVSAGVAFALEFQAEPAAARNVVAIVPGSDPALRGQYVAIGAHSDHDPVVDRALDHDSLRTMAELRARLVASLPAGQRPTPAQLSALVVNVDSLRALRSPRPDSIKNGADDDGSGTVALLEIAEAFALAPTRPRRSLLLVWHAAEELGLLGAAHFTEHPTVPLDSIVANLNLDMVGRGGVGDIAGGGPEYVQLVGSRRLSRELGDLVEAVNARRARPFRFDYALDADGHPERIYCRSDHAMYARHGIPVTFFTTGLHKDYHQVTDEPQYIEYDKMAELTQLVADVAAELASRAARPRLDGPRPDPTAPCRQ